MVSHLRFPPGLASGLLLAYPRKKTLKYQLGLYIIYTGVGLMSLREQIEANFHLVFSKEIRDILIEGIKRGISIHERGIKTDRERLG